MLTHNGRIHELSDMSSLCQKYDFVCIFDVQSLLGVAHLLLP